MKVFLIRPPDEKWLRMKALYDGNSPERRSHDVMDFFGWAAPDPAGYLTDITATSAVKVVDKNMLAIDPTKLPAGCTIRVVNLFG